ncbi:MAG: hypothetical protein HY904_22955 [Deltaproteobacteria bacterium]|nr:hypothetical protein [Deltaproteobacteria bacterium]
MSSLLVALLAVVAQTGETLPPRVGCVVVIPGGVLPEGDGHRVEASGAAGLRAGGQLERVVEGAELELLVPADLIDGLRRCSTDACRAGLLRPLGVDVAVLVDVHPMPGRVGAAVRWFDVRLGTTARSRETEAVDVATAAVAVERMVTETAVEVLGPGRGGSAPPAAPPPAPAVTTGRPPPPAAPMAARVVRVVGGVWLGLAVSGAAVAAAGLGAASTTYAVFATVPGLDRYRRPLQGVVWAGVAAGITGVVVALASATAATGTAWVTAWL